MLKKSLLFFSVILIVGALVLIGCSNPTSGKEETDNTVYPSPSGSAPSGGDTTVGGDFPVPGTTIAALDLQQAINENSRVIISGDGIIVTGADVIVVSEGKKLWLLGNLTLANEGILVVMDDDGLEGSGAGQIKQTTSSTFIATPALLTKYNDDAAEVPLKAINDVAEATVAVKGPVTIGTTKNSKTIPAATLAGGALYVLDGTLTVDTDVTADITVFGDVEAKAEITGDIVAKGNVTASDTITGDVTVTGDVTASEAITGALSATGVVTFTDVAQDALTDLTAGSLTSDVAIDASSATVTITGSATINDDFTAAATTFKGITTIKGDITANGDITVDGGTLILTAAINNISQNASEVIKTTNGGTITIGTTPGYTTSGTGVAAAKATIEAAISDLNDDIALLANTVNMSAFGGGTTGIGSITLTGTTATAIKDGADGSTGSSITLGSTLAGTLTATGDDVTGTHGDDIKAATFTLSLSTADVAIADGDYASTEEKKGVVTFDAVKLQKDELISPVVPAFSIGVITKRAP
jgi:hypothetical protein